MVLRHWGLHCVLSFFQGLIWWPFILCICLVCTSISGDIEAGKAKLFVVGVGCLECFVIVKPLASHMF